MSNLTGVTEDNIVGITLSDVRWIGGVFLTWMEDALTKDRTHLDWATHCSYILEFVEEYTEYHTRPYS